MEKKYRHKKKGIVVIQMRHTPSSYYTETVGDILIPEMVPAWIVEDNEDWELVIDKEYEIVAYRDKGEVLNYVEKRSRYETDGGWAVITPEYAKQHKVEIYSVKRLSDGEVFTIGDSVKPPVGSSEVIGHIKIDTMASAGIWLESKDKNYSIGLGAAIKQEPVYQSMVNSHLVKMTQDEYMLYTAWKDAKEIDKKEQKKDAEPVVVIMTTADDIDVYDPGQMLYWVDEDWKIYTKMAKHAKNKQIRPYYANEESAKNYIRLNKSVISLADIRKMDDGISIMNYVVNTSAVERLLDEKLKNK